MSVLVSHMINQLLIDITSHRLVFTEIHKDKFVAQNVMQKYTDWLSNFTELSRH